ncbi:hypothetical protein ROSMUCSMR3_00410 [Roseovarius mucosus]|uniref:Uncharacterized protein n=1 Tax=Roseovarius mucosus TaxID=215743 RepID=A0A1V0RJS5_9RHOB|nr:hypothetical protein ROSMUCSMR3_00410 [Roseovarius mucosus]
MNSTPDPAKAVAGIRCARPMGLARPLPAPVGDWARATAAAGSLVSI